MRLREFKWHLDQALVDLAVSDGLQGVPLQNGTSGVAIVGANAGQIRRALKHLAELPPYESSARQLLGHGAILFAEDDKPIQGEQAAIQAVQHALKIVLRQAAELKAAVDTIVEPEDSQLISFRLPKCETLQEVQATLSSLVETFDAPARRLFGQGVRFVGLDRGSDWLEFAAVTGTVFTFTTALIHTCFEFVQRRTQAESAAAVLRSLEVTSGALEEPIAALAQELATRLVNEHKPSEAATEVANETIPLVINALKALGDLYTRGAEVQLAFCASNEQVTKMPSTKQLAEVLQAVAQLRSKNE